MQLQITNEMIPGTLFRKDEMGGVTGKEFLDKVFFVESGISLSGIRKISGIDGSTLQNWTKRGWVALSKCKKYNKNQLAHILIINMLRSCMQLEHISFLIEYVNGDVADESDDIISDSDLYGTICECLNRLDGETPCDDAHIREVVLEVTQTYREPIPGAKERLVNALEILLISYFAALFKRAADERLERIR